MGIVQINTDVPAQIGESPRRVKIISTDNLSTVTTAGYLNNVSLQGYTIYTTDVIDMIYSYNVVTKVGIYNVLIPSITNGVITLSLWANAGDVLLPVNNLHFASFNGTSGQIFDAGYLPSDTSKTKVVMSSGAITANHVAKFADTNGTVEDGGVLGTAAAKAASDNTKATLASVSAATVSGNLAKFSDTAGTVADQGVAFKSVAGSVIAGGSATNSITDAFCTSGSSVIGNFNTQANAANVLTITPGNGSFVVVSSADPGASTFNYIITK